MPHLQPSANPVFLANNEYMYFKIFQDSAASELSGYFDTAVWSRVVLQTSHKEDFAHHAVLALGALHATMDDVQGSTPKCDPRKDTAESHHQFALQHYGKALQLMRELTNIPLQIRQGCPRQTLLSCLLTTCFENYLGSQDNALAAAQAGVEVMSQRPCYTSWCDSTISLNRYLTHRSWDDIDILTMLERLEISVIVFNRNRRVLRRLDPMKLQQTAGFKIDFPAHFSSVREARIFCDIFVKRSLIWKDTLLQLSKLPDYNFGESDPVLRAKRAESFAQSARQAHLNSIQAQDHWFSAFKDLFKETRKHPGSKDFNGASIMMISLYMSYFMTHKPGRGSTECYYDQYHDAAQKLVALARELLESQSSASKRAVFTFDDGVVAGLFVVGVRCRDPVLRREALALLLDHPRREGFWDSASAATVTARVMDEEERGMVDGFVPEEARLRIEIMNPRLAQRKVILTCSRIDMESQLRYDLDDIVLTW